MAAVDYVKIEPEESEAAQILYRDFMPPFRTGYIRVGPERSVVPEYYLKFREAIDNFEVREDDVWVITHPKTGTTWVQEMVWCIQQDLDFEGAKENINTRFPNVDVSVRFDYREVLKLYPDVTIPPFVNDSVDFTNKMKSRRFIKCHLPWELMPKQLLTVKPKIVYCARNAKATCISYFHYCKLFEGYTGNLEDFSKLFVSETLTSSPYWGHVLPFWEHRNDSNILFLKFEDMKTDLPGVIRRTANFLGKNLTQAQVDKLTDHLSFASMQVNPAVNYKEIPDFPMHLLPTPEPGAQFMRQGKADGWKEEMSKDMVEQFDAWTKKRLEGTGLTY